MADKQYKEFCVTGMKADALYNDSRYREAQAMYQRLLRDVERSGNLDSFLVSKITLGLLLTHVRMGQFQEAVAIWTANLDESLYGIGIYGLEHAQCSVHDLICYDFVCAYLHSLTASDKQEAAKAVNQYMSRVCEQLQETGETEYLKTAVSNWKQHLNEIFGSRLPMDVASSLIETERALFGESTKHQPIGFPVPSDWDRPAHFQEMSRVVAATPKKQKKKA